MPLHLRLSCYYQFRDIYGLFWKYISLNRYKSGFHNFSGPSSNILCRILYKPLLFFIFNDFKHSFTENIFSSPDPPLPFHAMISLFVSLLSQWIFLISSNEESVTCFLTYLCFFYHISCCALNEPMSFFFFPVLSQIQTCFKVENPQTWGQFH